MALVTETDSAMRRYGPLVYSHFRRTLRDEERALWATRRAVDALLRQRFRSEREVVRWVRALRPLFVVPAARA